VNATPNGDNDGIIDQGRTGELAGGRPKLPLPLALSRLPPGRHNLPREFIQENQRTRLLAAALTVFGEHGYLDASVQSLTKEASTSRTTFYALFPDKAACFLATYEVAIEWLKAETLAGAAEAETWPLQVRAATGKVLSMLAADPRLARVCAVEVHLAGPRARARHRELVEQIGQALSRGRRETPGAKRSTALLEPFLLGGANSLIAQVVEKGEAAALAELTPDLTELLLSPYIEPVKARRIARRR
jgi:AcrR family transcriptional regulator